MRACAYLRVFCLCRVCVCSILMCMCLGGCGCVAYMCWVVCAYSSFRIVLMCGLTLGLVPVCPHSCLVSACAATLLVLMSIQGTWYVNVWFVHQALLPAETGKFRPNADGRFFARGLDCCPAKSGDNHGCSVDWSSEPDVAGRGGDLTPAGWRCRGLIRTALIASHADSAGAVPLPILRRDACDGRGAP